MLQDLLEQLAVMYIESVENCQWGEQYRLRAAINDLMVAVQEGLPIIPRFYLYY